MPSLNSAGWYLRFAVPIGLREFVFRCPAQRLILGGRPFARHTVAISATTDSSLDFSLSLAQCHEPELQSWEGAYTGHYRGGFEMSDFASCTPLPTWPGSAYEGISPSVWVEFTPAARSDLSWPEMPGDYPRYFVQWHARVTGPGSYGHLGGALYKMVVDSVLQVRAASDKDCH